MKLIKKMIKNESFYQKNNNSQYNDLLINETIFNIRLYKIETNRTIYFFITETIQTQKKTKTKATKHPQNK